MNQTKELTSRYHLLKNIVVSNWSAVLETHSALEEIKASKLYRVEFETWEDFCLKTLHKTPQHINRLLKSASVAEELTEESEPIGSLLKNESQARALSEVPSESRKDVIQKAASNGPVTAKSITLAAKESVPVVLDRTGFVIPTDSPAMTHWQRTAEANELLSALSRIKCRMEAAQDNRDKMYGEVNFSSVIADLQSAYQLLKVAVPYAVCPTCQGRVLSPCSTCKGRGLISEFYWKHKVPNKTKEIREKAIAALAAKKKDKK